MKKVGGATLSAAGLFHPSAFILHPSSRGVTS